MIGVEWRVDRVVRLVDGDSLRLFRSRPFELDGRHYRLADDPADEPDGVLVRLAWVNTPERGDHPGWENARADLVTWIGLEAVGQLYVVCYKSAGWDRLLVDLVDATGNSASQWLMTEGNGGAGWPPYTGAKA